MTAKHRKDSTTKPKRTTVQAERKMACDKIIERAAEQMVAMSAHPFQ